MKKRIIISTIIIFLIILCYIFYHTIYLDFVSEIKLSLNGEEKIILPLLSEYEEKGAKAMFRDDNITKLIKIKGKIDNTKIGEYIIKYEVSYKNKTKVIERKIKIVDQTNPEIMLNNNPDMLIYVDDKFEDPGVIAIDNYDGDITDKVVIENNLDVSKIGNYKIIYTVTDSSGNSASIERKIEVKAKPIIDGIAVLNYHFFYSDGENCGNSICLNTRKFEQQLKYLKENGYKTLTMEEFRAWMYGEISLPKKSVLLTIDDGAMGTGLHNGNKLIPLLEKYQAHATLFLITGWWDINNYKSPYLDIESHTNDMHNEGFCYGVARGARMLCSSYDVALEDLKKSIAITGSTKAFCFPFYAYNQKAIQVVKEAGFKLGFIGGNYKATKNTNKYLIPRYVIYDHTTLEQFISYIS